MQHGSPGAGEQNRPSQVKMRLADGQMKPITMVSAGEEVLIDGVNNDGLFTLGSVEAYAKKYGEDPASAVQKAIQNNHELAWVHPEAVVVTNYAPYYEERRRRVAAAKRLAAGDHVLLEGRVYVVEPAFNRNVRLRPVPVPRELTRYTVISYDAAQRWTFYDSVEAADEDAAFRIVAEARGYATPVAALTSDQLHEMAEGLYNAPPEDVARNPLTLSNLVNMLEKRA